MWASSCNGTKATPNLSADILGDWREEVLLWTTPDSSQLRIYTTTTPTSYRLFTPMHDPVYRLAIAWLNAAYNQPPHLGFYIGGGLANVTFPDITMVKAVTDPVSLSKNVVGDAQVLFANNILSVFSPEPIKSVTIYNLQGRLLHASGRINHSVYSCNLSGSENIVLIKIETGKGVQVSKVLSK